METAQVVDAWRAVLAPEEWRPLAERHAARVAPWVTPHLERRRAGRAHPVEDFLFTYYSQRPAALQRWHPGFGIALAGGEEYAGLKGYAERRGAVGIDLGFVGSRRTLLDAVRRLLVATASREPELGCFGMHEWAMVYRLGPDDVRHAAWPLRLGARRTDAVVDRHRVRCSHFDAFRFFTPAAVPLNTLAPRADDRADREQPGCLHANMDLYKHAFRLSPMVPSPLVADCFALAREIRVLDMRASPYDLSALGYDPIRVETAEGKREYAESQRAFADRARPLRAQLVEECDRLLAVVADSGPAGAGAGSG